VVTGVNILPRQDGNLDGNIGRYEIYTSNDSTKWNMIQSGSLENNRLEKNIKFLNVCRFLKLKVLSEAAGNKNTNISEINVLDSNGIPYDRSKWVVSADSSTISKNSPWGGPSYAIDGNVNTFWMTNWEKSDPPPHEYLIDMGDVQEKKFEVTPNFIVSWMKSPEPDVGQYELMYGTISKKYDTVITTKTNTQIFKNHPIGTYYVSVVAVNSYGLKSEPSSEIVVVVSPKNVVITSPELTVNNGKRYVNVQMSTDGGKTYQSIGMVPYPIIKGQKYKTNIVTEK
jgi:hypothetical protein